MNVVHRKMNTRKCIGSSFRITAPLIIAPLQARQAKSATVDKHDSTHYVYMATYVKQANMP